MSLSAKLSRLQAEAGHGGQGTQRVDSDLRQRLARINSVSRPPCPEPREGTLDEVLCRRLKGYPLGEGLIQISRRIPFQGTWGRHPLSLLQRPPTLPGDLHQLHRRQVYIDTETTGLSGGSGTLAFLIGIAWVEDESLQLTQYLITRFAAEGAMLDAFAGALSAEDRLISYNGKCFDLPLLKSRHRMHGREDCLQALPHLDLLHPVRRLYSSIWPDCRLLTLEQRLLGLKRHNDLPGSAAPEAWFEFVRSGSMARLIRVVEHNFQDILSLAMAHTVLSQAIEMPQRYGADIVALARWLADHDEIAAYALLKPEQRSLSPRGMRLLGRLARRCGDWELAVNTWQALAETGCRNAIEQLAKFHEHISKDLQRAKYYCEKLPADDEQSKRLRRIVNKLEHRMIQPALHH
jgi:hypothetical protein